MWMDAPPAVRIMATINVQASIILRHSETVNAKKLTSMPIDKRQLGPTTFHQWLWLTLYIQPLFRKKGPLEEQC